MDQKRLDQVRVGFIGAGGIAERHLDNLLSFYDARVVAFSDPLLERALTLGRKAGKAQAFDDAHKMLDAVEMDALIICVPPFAHGDFETAAVERSLPFLVEKPLATDWETAQRVAAQVTEKNLITAVGYHWRYLDTVEEAARLLHDHPARLALGYWLDSTPPPSWWRHEAESGGQMIEQTTHIFDLARLLVGEVESVYAAGARIDRAAYPDSDVYDVTTATLHFASGALGNLSSTCLLNWGHRVGLHLFSEGMAIELGQHDIMVDSGHGRPVRGANGDPVLRQDRDFIDAVRGATNHIRVPYAEALKTHLLTVAATQSAKTGHVVRLNEREEQAAAYA